MIFTGAFAVALSGALIPGPMLTLTAAHALRSGFKAGPLISAGHAAAELLLITVILLGFGSLLTRPAVMRWIFITGGLLLVFTAIRMLSLKNLNPVLADKTAAKKGSSFTGGILVSVSNPTWSIWWATIGIVYLTKALSLGGRGLAAFFTGHIAADFAWFSFVSFLVSRGKNRLESSLYRKFLITCALFLAGFGAWFIAGGLRLSLRTP